MNINENPYSRMPFHNIFPHLNPAFSTLIESPTFKEFLEPVVGIWYLLGLLGDHDVKHLCEINNKNQSSKTHMDVRYAGSHIHVVARVTHLEEADTHVENTDFIEQIHVI